MSVKMRTAKKEFSFFTGAACPWWTFILHSNGAMLASTAHCVQGAPGAKL